MNKSDLSKLAIVVRDRDDKGRQIERVVATYEQSEAEEASMRLMQLQIKENIEAAGKFAQLSRPAKRYYMVFQEVATYLIPRD